MNHCVPDWSFLHDHPRNSHSKSPRPVDELIELLWQDGHVVMNSQTERKVTVIPSLTTQCTEPEQVSKGSEPFKNSENVVQEEAAPWAQCSVDDSFENEFLQAFFNEHLRAASTSPHTMLAAQGDKIVKHMAPTINGISEERSSVAEQPTFPLFGKKPMPAQSGFASPFLHITNRNTGDLRNFTHFKNIPEIEKLPLNRNLGKSSMGYHVEPGESSSTMTKESSICASSQVHSLFYPCPSTTTKAASAEGLEDDAPAVIADDKETSDINETVDTTSSGASIGRTGKQNRQMIMHKRKGREGDEAECQSEEADGASVEKNMQFQRSSSARRRRAAEVHNLSERKRRDRINRKMRDLQELIPHCNKSDKASMLDEAIEYLKSLQLQVQIMWMRSGMVPMMFPGVHPFMPPMGMGMENTSLTSVQCPQLTHVPLVNQSVASNTDVNHVLLSPSDINQVNFRTQMQNVLQTHYPGFHHMQPCPQMLNVYTSGSQLMQQSQAAFANSNLAPRVGDTSPVKAQHDSLGKSA